MISEGMLLVNKPRGLTSHDVVQILRRRLAVRRIGHTGTLDPAAEGLLILLIGNATEHQQRLQGHEKTYEGAIRLGSKTETADADGKVIASAPVPPLSQEVLEKTLAEFQGALSQTPPAYSAVKVHGRPAYWWARRQKTVTLQARTVQVHEFALLGFDTERIRCRVRCSAGTYIRSLAETVAERLGTVGYLESLTRTSIGEWSLGDAVDVNWLLDADPAAIRARIRPVRFAAAPPA